MLFVVLSVLTGVAGCAAMRDQQRPAATRERAATGSYAVVVSQQTYAIAEWKQVVETLR